MPIKLKPKKKQKWNKLQSKTLHRLKSIRRFFKKNWNDEFQRRFLSPQPNSPLVEPVMEPMVHLGCINGTYINDLVTSSLTIPGNTITYWINQLLSQQL